jgi:uncharacterized protein YutE (UPF0331/DUF86 family)
LKKTEFKVTVIPIKLFDEEGVLSEKEFEEVKEKMEYKGMKVLEIKDLGTDEVRKWMHFYDIVTVSEGGGLFDCYYGDDILVEKLKGVGAIVIRDKDGQPVRTMKTLVAKWYKKQVVYEEKAYKICNKFVT